MFLRWDRDEDKMIGRLIIYLILIRRTITGFPGAVCVHTTPIVNVRAGFLDAAEGAGRGADTGGVRYEKHKRSIYDLSNGQRRIKSGKPQKLPFWARWCSFAMLHADGLLRPRADWSVSAGSGITCTACEHEVKQLRGAARAC